VTDITISMFLARPSGDRSAFSDLSMIPTSTRITCSLPPNSCDLGHDVRSQSRPQLPMLPSPLCFYQRCRAQRAG
jgi:hypothetical protein